MWRRGRDALLQGHAGQILGLDGATAALRVAQVVETYLIERWSERKADLGPVPTGESAVALMRLVVQAQNAKEQLAIAAAFHELGEDDRHVLTTEMAMTGILGQTYTTFPDAASIVGPAFLVYYSPAFVRTVAKHEPLTALQILAEVYRAARAIWPSYDQQQLPPSQDSWGVGTPSAFGPAMFSASEMVASAVSAAGGEKTAYSAAPSGTA